jgi:hypothetical protein
MRFSPGVRFLERVPPNVEPSKVFLLLAPLRKDGRNPCPHPKRFTQNPRLYNPGVARGWESKSVESQQDDARSTGESKPRLTPAQREIASRQEGLKLSRSRILEQIRSTQNPLYRKTLEQALAALDEQLRLLG